MTWRKTSATTQRSARGPPSKSGTQLWASAVAFSDAWSEYRRLSDEVASAAREVGITDEQLKAIKRGNGRVSPPGTGRVGLGYAYKRQRPTRISASRSGSLTISMWQVSTSMRVCTPPRASMY
jgi:hypothetical protein